jgi:hypothetical protein
MLAHGGAGMENYFVTVKITFCKSESREELPTMISNSPGSTTYFMWTS